MVRSTTLLLQRISDDKSETFNSEDYFTDLKWYTDMHINYSSSKKGWQAAVLSYNSFSKPTINYLLPAFVLCVQYKYRQCLAPTCIIYECHIRIEGSLADIHHATRSSPERAVNRCNDVTYLFKFNRSKRSCSQFKFFEFYSCYSISVRVEMCFTVLQWIESTLHTRYQKFT